MIKYYVFHLKEILFLISFRGLLILLDSTYFADYELARNRLPITANLRASFFAFHTPQSAYSASFRRV